MYACAYGFEASSVLMVIVYIDVSVYVCVRACAYTYVCMRVCAYGFEAPSVLMVIVHVCVCVCDSVRVYMYTCACVCIYALCVCMRVLE
jgi:hypothetical protein